MKHVVITKVLPGCCIRRNLDRWLGAVIDRQIPLSLGRSASPSPPSVTPDSRPDRATLCPTAVH